MRCYSLGYLSFVLFSSSNPLNTLARLVNGNSPSEGRVEVYHDGIWGTVCDHSWSSRESRILCQSLGFPDQVSTLYNAYFGEGTGAILLNHVNCVGNESSIFNCSHNGIGNNHCGHNDDVGVKCQQTGKLSGNTSFNYLFTCFLKPDFSFSVNCIKVWKQDYP